MKDLSLWRCVFCVWLSDVNEKYVLGPSYPTQARLVERITLVHFKAPDPVFITKTRGRNSHRKPYTFLIINFYDGV